LSRFCDLRWVLRSNKSREIRVTPLGNRKFQAIFSEQAGKTK